MKFILPLSFAAVFGIVGFFCLLTALRWRRDQRGFRPDNELRVYGKLTHFQREPKAYRGRHGNDTPTDILDFTYSYEVDGKTYTTENRLVKNGIRLPGGTEIVCQRSDPRQCYIPGLTSPPAEDAHDVLYWIGGACLLGALYFLSLLP